MNVTIWGGGAPLDSWGSLLREGATEKRRKSGAIGAIADPGLRRFCAAYREPRWQVLGLFGDVSGRSLGQSEECERRRWRQLSVVILNDGSDPGL